MYIKLCNFGKYTEDKGSSKAKQQPDSDTSPDIHRKIRVYRMISLILFAICVLLMIVVLVLSVKLTGKQPCEIVKDTDRTPLVQECSLTKCQEIYKQQLVHVSEQCVCNGCGRDWLHFEDSCYFLSQDRLNWQKSREECQKKGGDLAIITNERVQMYLTEKGKLHYWIGLNHVGTNQWEWINNNVLTVRYWGDVSSSGDCALLATNEPPAQSWHRSSCRMYLQYICQKSLGSP
ncbi:killer cell lectin-like receptor subfamily B member 1B allele B isoform X2 [Xyrauchen texanus]|uniref:killer cell lectin-like receptor subfamily B member 1B allele B isoform X2 n=1 Tax=Xyrauchen texanus TaxID=154827 RepID=UPI00224204DE|nr:killer cell lectin-like receptor subfamily B member 1B allele B isoform X2 [Xyrauchen texanus]